MERDWRERQGCSRAVARAPGSARRKIPTVRGEAPRIAAKRALAAMVFGVINSLAVGFGLMALLFYGSRKGFDEPPVLIVPENDSMESKKLPRQRNTA
jgi:hypothetical protein